MQRSPRFRPWSWRRRVNAAKRGSFDTAACSHLYVDLGCGLGTHLAHRAIRDEHTKLKNAAAWSDACNDVRFYVRFHAGVLNQHTESVPERQIRCAAERVAQLRAENRITFDRARRVVKVNICKARRAATHPAFAGINREIFNTDAGSVQDGDHSDESEAINNIQ